MTVLLVGANPGLSLLGASGERIAVVSVWRVDWSVRGRGRAIVLWHEGRTRVISAEPDLGLWLAGEFVRHFPETAGLDWPPPLTTVAPVEFGQDLAQGLRASGADVTVEIDGPLDRRIVSAPDFPIGSGPAALFTVFAPCAEGRLTVAGALIAGEATAFLAEAEVWSAQATE